MKRERAKTLLPIIEAYAAGADIQIKTTEKSNWRSIAEPDFSNADALYRIKPVPRMFWGTKGLLFFSRPAAELRSEGEEIIRLQEVFED